MYTFANFLPSSSMTLNRFTATFSCLPASVTHIIASYTSAYPPIPLIRPKRISFVRRDAPRVFVSSANALLVSREAEMLAKSVTCEYLESFMPKGSKSADESAKKGSVMFALILGVVSVQVSDCD